MLIVFGGLPGSGKSTIARLLAQHLKATYLRIDTIEQALRGCGTLPAGLATEGYAVAYVIAQDNLCAGATVIADSVNPLMVTRDAWLSVAHCAGLPVLEIEVICSDAGEHRRRIETRQTDIPGLVLPTWQNVLHRVYEPWNRPHLVVDTASHQPAACVATILSRLPASRA